METTQPLSAIPPKPKPRTKPTGNHIGGPFVALDKNLCHFPIARDYRSPDWKKWQGRETGRWNAEIKHAGIRFGFAPDTDKSLIRCADAFDVNTLAIILATSQHRGNPQVIFESRSEILRLLGYGTDTGNIRRLDQALTFWQAATLQYDRWYFGKVGKGRGKYGWRQGGTYDKRILPPPIKVVKSEVNCGFAVRIADAWLQLNAGYFEKVPLPLPRQAAPQNMVLMLMVSWEPRLKPMHERLRRSYCRKPGINHSRRNQVLDRAMTQAEAWFKLHGGSLMAIRNDKLVGFVLQQRPRRPPSKKSIKRRRLQQQPPQQPVQALPPPADTPLSDYQQKQRVIDEFNAVMRGERQDF